MKNGRWSVESDRGSPTVRRTDGGACPTLPPLGPGRAGHRQGLDVAEVRLALGVERGDLEHPRARRERADLHAHPRTPAGAAADGAEPRPLPAVARGPDPVARLARLLVGPG